MHLPNELPPKFLSKVDLRGDEDCWLWTGSINKFGYGRFRFGGADSVGGKVWYAHLFAWTVVRRIPTEGLSLDHLCGIRNCVNPNHLELVTHSENVRRARKADGSITTFVSPLPKELPDSFLKKVSIVEANDCWKWKASLNAQGYGRFRFGGSDSTGGKVWYAHVFSYRVVSGDHSEDGVIDHLCNNRGCVNPKHLEKVTQQENLRRIYGRDIGP